MLYIQTRACCSRVDVIGCLEIEKLRLAREKERDDAQRQRDERFANILESHLESNKAVMEQVVDLLEQVKALLAAKDAAGKESASKPKR